MIRAAARTTALVIIAALIIAAAAASFAESYRGLYDWASLHSYTGRWAMIAPLMADTFIAVGELTLFVTVLDGYGWQARLSAWASTLTGLAMSVAGNVGHVWPAPVSTSASAAVPPIAAGAALWTGLGLLKLLTRAARCAACTAKADRARAARVPRIRTALRRAGTAWRATLTAQRERAAVPPEPEPEPAVPPPPVPPAEPPPSHPPVPARRAGRRIEPSPEVIQLVRDMTAAGNKPSERWLANQHLGGSRRAAQNALAAAQNGASQ